MKASGVLALSLLCLAVGISGEETERRHNNKPSITGISSIKPCQAGLPCCDIADATLRTQCIKTAGCSPFCANIPFELLVSNACRSLCKLNPGSRCFQAAVIISGCVPFSCPSTSRPRCGRDHGCKDKGGVCKEKCETGETDLGNYCSSGRGHVRHYNYGRGRCQCCKPAASPAVTTLVATCSTAAMTDCCKYSFGSPKHIACGLFHKCMPTCDLGCKFNNAIVPFGTVVSSDTATCLQQVCTYTPGQQCSLVPHIIPQVIPGCTCVGTPPDCATAKTTCCPLIADAAKFTECITKYACEPSCDKCNAKGCFYKGTLIAFGTNVPLAEDCQQLSCESKTDASGVVVANMVPTDDPICCKFDNKLWKDTALLTDYGYCRALKCDKGKWEDAGMSNVDCGFCVTNFPIVTVKTFDNVFLAAPLTCNYALAQKGTSLTPEYGVFTKYVEASAGVHEIESVVFKDKTGDTYSIADPLTFDPALTAIPTEIAPGSALAWTEADDQSTYVMGSNGLFMIWATDVVAVFAPHTLQGEVKGLCGDFDQSTVDDLLKRSGGIVPNPAVPPFLLTDTSFATSWKTATQVAPCDTATQLRADTTKLTSPCASTSAVDMAAFTKACTTLVDSLDPKDMLTADDKSTIIGTCDMASCLKLSIPVIKVPLECMVETLTHIMDPEEIHNMVMGNGTHN